MGNCSPKPDMKHNSNLIRVLTDSGSVLQFKDPKQVHQVLQNYPGCGIFHQGHFSSPLSLDESLSSTKLYYLLPLGAIDGHDEVKISQARSDVVDNLANGPDLEVLPSGRDGIWRVKLAIDPKRLEEVFSEQVHMEALIQKMRMVAASGSSASPVAVNGKKKGWKQTLFKLV